MKNQIETKTDTKLQGAAEQGICDDCRTKFYNWIGHRTDQLADLIMDYKSDWVSTLNLDEDGFDNANAEEQEKVAKTMKEYDVLQDFQVAVGALMAIKEKTSRRLS